MSVISTPVGRRALLGGSLAAIAVGLVGCNANSKSNPSPSAGTTGSQAPAAKGGTLRILTGSTSVNWDPAISQSLAITSLGLVQRRLTGWDTSGATTKVVPDLAADTGTASDGGKTWTFKLKPGLKFEDGTPIKAADVKYSIERSFAPELSGGLGYHKSLLVGAESYKGPFQGKQLDSIETPDDTTIVFKLNAPYGDWPWVASTPAFAAVPKAKDNIKTYTSAPVATGPYKVAKTVEGTSITLDRNPNWSQDTDPVRVGGPDQIIFQLGQDATVAAQRLIADSGDDQSAFGAGFVPAAQLAQVQSGPAKSRLVTSGAGAVAYLAINNQAEGLTDVKVREAIALAVDRKAFLVAVGGEISGEYASTWITPGIAGREEYDFILTGIDPSGDAAKAKAKLTEAGWKNRELKLASADDSVSLAESQAIQQGLQRAGFTVKIVSMASDVLTQALTQGDGSKYDLAISSWQPDFPSPNGNIQPLFDSSQIGGGGYNVSRFKNAEVDALIAKATGTTDPAEAGKVWAQADKAIGAAVPGVPLVYTKNSFLHGSKVAGFKIPSFPAYPNYLQVTVAQ